MLSIPDWQNCALDAVLRAAGRQALGAGLNTAVYWGWGPLVLWYLGFKVEGGVRGLLVAVVLIATVQFIALAVRILPALAINCMHGFLAAFLLISHFSDCHCSIHRARGVRIPPAQTICFMLGLLAAF